MTLTEAMKTRHAVRSYTDRKIEPQVLEQLLEEIRQCNEASGLHMQLITDEPQAFTGLMARYGKFSNVRNYLALVSSKGGDTDETVGYFGQRVVLKATTLGLDTCWVVSTYRKGKCPCRLELGESLRCVITLGYGVTHGVPHKSKPTDAVCKIDGPIPDWFRSGIEAALLAPTAINQQKFFFTLSGNQVTAKANGGFYTKLDLGIAKYQFELGAGKENFVWA